MPSTNTTRETRAPERPKPFDRPGRVSRSPDPLRLVRALARRQQALSQRIAKAEEIADAIACDLLDIEQLLDTGMATAAERRAPMAGDGSRARQLLRVTAESGITAIDLTPRADGSSAVSVDGGKTFTLPPLLADLLVILATDTGRSTDGLIGWLTLDEVAILLAKQLGRRVTRHAVTQQIYRLRKELFVRGGVNPFLLQTSRRNGVRLALRRKDKTVTSDK